jgi:hypothetical protein
MKILKLFILSFVIFLLAAPFNNAQGIKIGVGIGLTNIMAPDELTNDISEGGSGFSSEFNILAKCKISLPAIPITPIGYVQYTSMGGEQSTQFGNIETSMSILSIGAGAEISLVPGPLSPYLSLDLSYNSFGDYEIKAPELAGGNQTSSGESRTGLGLGVGAELSLILITIDVSARYNFYNLLGKESEEESINAIILNAAVLF